MRPRWLIPIIIILIIVGIVKLFVLRNYPNIPTQTEGSLASIRTGPAPWPADSSLALRSRLAAIGLPALVTEGDVLHTHQHLDIVVDGQPIAIPAQIGVPDDQSFIAPLHTHDGSGIIHVESPTVQTFTLGQFFNIWGVMLTDTCLASYCQDNNHIFRVYSNGSPVTDPQGLSLTSHQEIYIYYGASSSLPKAIPASYQFPPDY